MQGDWLKPGCVVIDVGINSVDDSTKKRGYRLVGDVDFEAAQGIAGAITPGICNIYLSFCENMFLCSSWGCWANDDCDVAEKYRRWI